MRVVPRWRFLLTVVALLCLPFLLIFFSHSSSKRSTSRDALRRLQQPDIRHEPCSPLNAVCADGQFPVGVMVSHDHRLSACVAEQSLFSTVEHVTGASMLHVVILDLDDGLPITTAHFAPYNITNLRSWIEPWKEDSNLIVAVAGAHNSITSARWSISELQLLVDLSGAKSLLDWAHRTGGYYAMIAAPSAKAATVEKVWLDNAGDVQLYKCFATESEAMAPSFAMRHPQWTAVSEWSAARLGPQIGSVQFGREMKNCGMTAPCSAGQTALWVWTGRDKDDTARLCIGGRLLFDRNLNDAGRGLNIAVLAPQTLRVRRTAHFDTYAQESSALEAFLESIARAEIVVVVSFDEASTHLSDAARHLFYDLGSSLVASLKFRSSWFFVGQKGIDGFSPFEDLVQPTSSSWPAPINSNICIPRSLSGHTKGGKPFAAQHRASRNEARRLFCSKWDGFYSLCAEHEQDVMLNPPHLSNVSGSMYSMRILLVVGIDVWAAEKSLRALWQVPGLRAERVTVAHLEDYPIAGDMARAFGAVPLPIKTTTSYQKLVNAALASVFGLWEDGDWTLLINEDAVVTPDLLTTLQPLFDLALKDASIALIGAVNPYERRGWKGSVAGGMAIRVQASSGITPPLVIRRTAFLRRHPDAAPTEEAKNTTGSSPFSHSHYNSGKWPLVKSDEQAFVVVTSSQLHPSQQQRATLQRRNEVIATADAYDRFLEIYIGKGLRQSIDRLPCHPRSPFPANFSSQSIPLVVEYGNETELLSLYHCLNLDAPSRSSRSSSLPLSYKGALRLFRNTSELILLSHTSPFVRRHNNEGKTSS